MLKNYFKTAIRNLLRARGNTAINIAGLTLGITSSLVLFLLIRHALSFDTYHTHYDRIYRVTVKSQGNRGDEFTSGIPAVLPEAFKNDFPEAEEVVFTSYRANSLITIPQKDGTIKKFDQDAGVVHTQPSYFKVFDRKVLMGQGEKGLDEPNEAVIAAGLAQKYFGRQDVLGEIVRFDNRDYKISGVVDDAPSNTDLPFDLLLSHITIKKQSDEQGWNSIWSDEQCYFRLKEGETIAAIEARVPDFVKKYLGDDNEDEQTFLMQPLADVHFDDRFSNYRYNVTPRRVLISLSVIAIFLVVTACINFINLTTAEAIKRSKEVGIRKSLGSTHGQLVLQFLGETALVTTVAVILSLGLAQLTLTFLNPFLDETLSLHLNSDMTVWIFLATILVVVSVLSGLYPSFVVSGYKPALALKNLISNRNSSGYHLRRALVVTQFFISQFLIIGTVVLVKQMDFFEKKDLGFNREAIVNIPIPVQEEPGETAGSKMRTLKTELLRIAGVEKATLNNSAPSSSSVSATNFRIDGTEENYGTQVKQVDGDYIPLYDLKLLAGKNVADLDTATGFIVNDKLAKLTGHNNVQDIVGKNIRMWGRSLPVVGVVNDFHTVSLSSAIEPVVLMNRLRGYGNISLKLQTADLQGVLKNVQAKWEATYPDFIFSYEFLDEHIRGFYDGQRRMSTLLTLFASLAIVISCLGLFGLATFMANQKTKEIGIRKVLGASVESILLLFSKEFVVLIGVGFVLAAPAAWWVATQYLEQFEYRITLGPAIFILSIFVTLLIAFFTVGFKSFKAATVNPAQSLKTE